MAVTVKKILRAIEQLDPAIFEECGMGEVEDTVVDMKEMGQFGAMNVDSAALLAIKEVREMYA
jgi:hypothetical protein